MSESTPPPVSTKARLLVAGPGLLDPNFRRTVVLILEHNDDGALGLVLNRARLVGGADVRDGKGAGRRPAPRFPPGRG